MIKRSSLNIFAAVYLTVLIVLLFWFFSGGATLKIESPLRMVLGALFIFIMPGIIWGEVLKFRSSHILETIALSFAITLAIGVFLLPIPFFFASTIKLWVGLVFVISFLGLVMFVVKKRRGEDYTFIKPIFDLFKEGFPLNVSSALAFIVLVVISVGVYRWGENLTDISGEKLLHAVFTRYYYAMPMILRDLGIHQGVPPSNLVNLWEYLIAGWASVIHMDPLPLFNHARFVIPFLGFSSMYLLIRNIFSDRIKTEIIFWSVLIMSIGGFILLSPSNLDWVKGDPYRLVTSFMGTVHHSDSAMDVILALGIAIFVGAIRNFNKKKYLVLLFGVLSAIFMWHTREFFQVAVYSGIFGLVMLVIPHPDKNEFRNWLVAALVFVIVIITVLPIIKSVSSHQAQGYNELLIKKAALKYSFSKDNILGIRNFFNFPLHFALSSGNSPDVILGEKSVPDLFGKEWNYALWLILSAIAVPILALWGSREDRRLAVFYVFLWFLILGWNFSMLLLIFFTYSEIFMSTPRFIYLFSYLVIASALLLVYEIFKKRFAKSSHKVNAVYFLSIISVGFIIGKWWGMGIPAVNTITIILSAAMFISLGYIVISRNRPSIVRTYKPAFMISAMLGTFLFFYPIIGRDMNKNFFKIIKESRPDIEWFSNSNPFAFSPRLIQYLGKIPPKQNFLVNPLGTDLISLYVPQYTAVVPEIIGTIISERNTYAAVREGKDPLFIIKGSAATQLPKDYIKKNIRPVDIDHTAVKNMLNNSKVDYIFIHKEYYPVLKPYFEKFSSDYDITFDNQSEGEMVAHYRGKHE